MVGDHILEIVTRSEIRSPCVFFYDSLKYAKMLLTILLEGKMKLTLVCVTCFLLLAAGLAYAGDKGSSRFPGQSGGYFRKDPISGDRMNIYDRNGSLEGYTKKDPIIKDRWNIYDSKGRQKGFIRQDPLSEDRKNFYDKDGRQEWYLKKDPLFEDRTNVYDRKGRQEGYLQTDPVIKDRTNIYRNPK
jgi:hypothetical protein